MADKGWYSVRLKKTATGPRRRLLKMGGGSATFDLDAPDGDRHTLRLGDAVAEELRASGNWDVDAGSAPKPKGAASEPLTVRPPMGEAPVKPKKKESGEPSEPVTSEPKTEEVSNGVS